MSDEKILIIKNMKKQIDAYQSDISHSKFEDINAEKLLFKNVCLAGTKITDANLSDLEIDGAQIGGAYIHHIGMPPEEHPYYDPNNTKQRPVRFEYCDLNNSSIKKSDLSNLEITDCKITGMKINGIKVEDLLKAYEEIKK